MAEEQPEPFRVHKYCQQAQFGLAKELLISMGEAAPRELATADADDARTPLHWAVSNANAVDAENFIRYCCEIDEKVDERLLATATGGWTVLMTAASVGGRGVCLQLLSAATSDTVRSKMVNSRNAQRNSALHFAVAKNFIDVARLLLDNGADVNAANRLQQTPLHRTIAIVEDDKGTTPIPMLELLLSRGAKVNKTASDGNNLLMMAAEDANKDLLYYLLARRNELSLNLSKLITNDEGKSIVELVGGERNLQQLIERADELQAKADNRE